MGVDTKIQWTTHTFNPWWGCVKVHNGCKNCYAENVANRWGFDVWGPNTERRLFGDAHWKEPLNWNAKAEASGERHRVFCASMADVFEEHPQLPEQRKRLFDLICRTSWLDWQILTKRPENALRMMVEAGLYATANPSLPRPQPNLWIGTSPCDQKTADESIPHLLMVPAAVRFLSLEPLLGPIDVQAYCHSETSLTAHHADGTQMEQWKKTKQWIHWVIVGGESGPGARLCAVNWIADIMKQCEAAGVPVFVKQLGSQSRYEGASRGLNLRDSKGGDMNEWPEDLRVRQMPDYLKPERRG